MPTGRAGSPQGCQECTQSLGTDQASHALSTFEENMTPPTEQPWPPRPSCGRVILGAEEPRVQRGGHGQKPGPGLPPGLRVFLAGRCSGAVLCVPAVYTCSPQLLLDVSRGGVHTQDVMGVSPPPSGLSTRHPLIP